MVYLIVIILTVISIFFIILLFDPSLFSKLRTKSRGLVDALRSHLFKHNSKKVNAIKAQPLPKKTDKSPITWLTKHYFIIASSGLILLTLGMCYWLLNYSSLDVYHDVQVRQNDYSSQINQLLMGERLQPPPAPPEELFEELDAEIASYNAFKNEDDVWDELTTNTTKFSFPSSNREEPVINMQDLEEGGYSSDMLSTHLNNGYINIKNADRNWNKMNSQFVQRLLMVYKIMHDQYGYDMVLLEGYRSPQRQARLLAKGSHVTNAGSYRSYHQFGLAADSAFIRNGKIVISERDPWAMQGYRLYGKVAKSVGLVWGGDWRMKDLGHVELRKKGVLGRPEMAKILTNQ